MWMVITSAMCEFVGLGRNRTLKDVIVCWTYAMTDPARGMGYARLYSSIGNPVKEAKAVARKVSGGARKNGPAQTAEQTQAAKLKAWNHMVPREVILADYYAHLVQMCKVSCGRRWAQCCRQFFASPPGRYRFQKNMLKALKIKEADMVRPSKQLQPLSPEKWEGTIDRAQFLKRATLKKRVSC